jgi:hypothetical protein
MVKLSKGLSAMQKSKFKIWLGRSQTSRVSWGDLVLVEVKWFSLDQLYVTVEGDGKDLEEWVSARRDIFGGCERLKSAAQ